MESAGNANKPYIFVSFTGEDEENVNEFCAELRRRNINAVTYESKDSEAAFGKNFADWRQFFLNRTQDKRCLAVVCFFTRQYFAHRATLEEICMLLEAADQFPPVYGFCPAGKRPDQFIDEIADYSNKNRGKNPFRSGPDHTYFVLNEERLRKLFDSHNIVIDSAADLVAALRPLFPQATEKRAPARAARGAADAATPADFLRSLVPESNSDALLRLLTRLSEALQRFRTSAAVAGAQGGDAVYRFFLKLPPNADPDKITRRTKDIGLAVGCPNLYFGRDALSGSLFIDVPRPDRQAVSLRDFLHFEQKTGEKAPLLRTQKKTDPPPRFPIGRGVGGELFFGDLGKTPHWLIGAADAQESKDFLAAAAAWLTARHPPEALRLLLVEMDGNTFNGFEGLPHLLYRRPVFTPRTAAEALREAENTMEKRFNQLRAHVSKRRGPFTFREYNAAVPAEDRWPWIVILLDEIGDFRRPYKDAVEASLLHLCQRGRPAGIFVLAATRYASSRQLSPLLKANLPGRVCFRQPGTAESRCFLDENGAETLLGRGDLLFRTLSMLSCERAQAPVSDKTQIFLPEGEGGAAPERPRLPPPAAVRLADFYNNPLFSDDKSRLVALGMADREGIAVGDLRRCPTWLVAGAAGSGKSNFLRALVADAACRYAPGQLRFALVDIGGLELGCFAKLPHLFGGVATTKTAAEKLIADVYGEIERRKKLFDRRGVLNLASYNAARPEGEPPLPDIAVVVDRCTPEEGPSSLRLQGIAAQGGAFGISLIAALLPHDVTPEFLAEMRARVVFRLYDPSLARLILREDSDTELFSPGELLYRRDTSPRAVPARSALVTYGEAQQIAAYLKNQAPPSGN